ncbi:MAG: NADH-quinone oxidoreductase subunit C, partial [Polymorphobacter sp.]
MTAHWPLVSDSTAATARVVALFGARAGFVLHGGADLTISVARADLHDTIRTLRDDADLQFTAMMDICGADYPTRPERFEVVYHLLSMVRNIRIRIKVTTDTQAPVASITDLYPVAGWF